jgi:hypothetical protein
VITAHLMASVVDRMLSATHGHAASSAAVGNPVQYVVTITSVGGSCAITTARRGQGSVTAPLRELI